VNRISVLSNVIRSLVVIGSTLVVGVGSAQAITIETTNKSTEFSAETKASILFKGGNKISCKKLTYHGNTYKTNYVTVTPAFEECKLNGIVGVAYANTTECAKGQSVPWTWTLTEGSNPFYGTTTLNCAATFTVHPGGFSCTIKVLQQGTPAQSLRWETGSERSFLRITLRELAYTSSGAPCRGEGFEEKGTLEVTQEEVTILHVKAVK
jgi:hypothetical protein